MTTTPSFRAVLIALLGTVLTASVIGLPAPSAIAATADAANPTAIDVPDSSVYRHSSAPIAVPDSGSAATYPSQLNFSGVAGTVVDVDVRLFSIQHGSLDDLDIMLVGPGGQNVMLMSDAGGGAASNLTLYFDDDVPSSVPDSTAPGGLYRPTNYGTGDTFPAPAPAPTGSALSAFDGTDPNGVWQLYIVDDSAGQSGSLTAGWTLVVRTTNTASVYPAPITVSGRSGQVTDVDVTLHGLAHNYPKDLDVLVVGPGGQRALVMSDVGGTLPVAGIDLVLDDEAASPLPENSVVQSGTFRPTDSDVNMDSSDTDDFIGDPGTTAGDGSALSVFDGTDPNGAWKLYVVDDAADDTGSIAGGWSLHITTPDPTPAPGPAPGSATPPSASGSDTLHPRVRATTPSTGGTRVRPGKNVRATFTEPVRRATLTSRTVKLVRKGTTFRVHASLTYDRATHTVTIDPSRRLRLHTTYQVVVTTGVQDVAGNALDQKPAVAGNQKARWTFTTR